MRAIKKARISFKSLASEEGDEKLIKITVLSAIPSLPYGYQYKHWAIELLLGTYLMPIGRLLRDAMPFTPFCG
jgi:hypothetical protein